MFKRLFSPQNKKGAIVLAVVALVVGVWLALNNYVPAQIKSYLIAKK